MIIGQIMDEIGNRLSTVIGLRVLPYDADDIQIPAATVSLPTNIKYHGTYGMGLVPVKLIVTIWVSQVDERVRRDQIAPYADTKGNKSIVQILESGTYTSFDTITVTDSGFDVLVVGAARQKYLTANFNCDIGARG